MRKLVLLAALATTCALAAATPALADQAGIPACADINGGNASYFGSTPPSGAPANTVAGSITLQAASCRGDGYFMFVVEYDSSGAATGVRFDRQAGDGSSSFFSFTVSRETAPFVCVAFVTTEGNTIWDVAPDAGCPSSIDPSPTATRPFNVLTPASGAPGGEGFI